MAKSKSKFSELLDKAIRQIAAYQLSKIGEVERKIGNAIGVAQKTVEAWRYGKNMPMFDIVEPLLYHLLDQGGFTVEEVIQFLSAANYSAPKAKEVISRYRGIKFHPFVVGPPIPYPCQFFGREEEVVQILGLWDRLPLHHVAVIGPQRSGRTSLLNYVMNITTALPAQLRLGQRTDRLSQPQLYRWVFVNFQNPLMRRQESLLRYILQKLEIPVPDPCHLIRFMEAVSDHIQNRTIILMDEIEAGLAAPDLDEEFWWGLRALVNETEGRVGTILAAQGIPMEVAATHGKPSPFFNIFGSMIELKPFSESEARQLIDSSPKPFYPDDVEWILKHSRRWPVLLQLLCQSCLNALEKGQRDKSWREKGLERLHQKQYQHLLEEAGATR